MKKLSRIKRVELPAVLPDQYIKEWEGCYILFQAQPYSEIQVLQKEFSKVTKKSRLLERSERKLRRQIAGEENAEKLDELENELEKVLSSQDDVNNEMISLSDKVLTSNFRGGMVKDDNDKLVELTKEDCLEFDTEVKGELISHITGTVSKKK